MLIYNLLLTLQGNAGVDSLAVAELDGGGRQEEERFPPGCQMLAARGGEITLALWRSENISFHDMNHYLHNFASDGSDSTIYFDFPM